MVDKSWLLVTLRFDSERKGGRRGILDCQVSTALMARMDALITPCACTKKKQGSIEFLTSQVSKEQAAQERQGIASGV